MSTLMTNAANTSPASPSATTLQSYPASLNNH